MQGAKFLTGLMSGPAERQTLRSCSSRLKIADQRPVASRSHDLFKFSCSPDSNDFLTGLDRVPVVSKQIARSLHGMKLFAIQFHIIAQCGGYAPCDPTIVTELNARRTRNGRSPYFVPIW